MRKTSVYLTDDEAEGLRRLAVREGRPQAELIREGVRKVIAENLIQEERIDAEAREILQGHSKEIRDTALDYSRIFNLVKGKLARDRGFIL